MNTWAEVKAEARRQGLLAPPTSMVEVCNDLEEMCHEAKRLLVEEGPHALLDGGGSGA